MTNNKVIVIGAGFGGLGSAILMARAGYEVTVVEKNDKVGGRANLLELDGYRRDMGPSWYLMPDAFDRYFTAIGRRVEDYLDLQKLEPSYRVFFKEGKDGKSSMQGYETMNDGANYLDLYADVDKAATTFESIEPRSGNKLRDYLKSAAYQYSIAMEKFVFKNFDSIWDFMTPQLAIEGLQLNVFTKLYSYVSRFVKNENLKKLLMYPSVFLGTSPYETPALFNIMSHVDFNQGVFYPQGGIHEIPKALYQIALEEGVKFEFNAEVEKIVVEDKKVVGAKLKNSNNDLPNFQPLDETMRIKSVKKCSQKYVFHASGKKIDILDPEYDRNRDFTVPVIFANSTPKSKMCYTPTEKYMQFREKYGFAFHRIMTEDRHILLGGKFGGYVYVLDGSQCYEIVREDFEVGKRTSHVEYVFTTPQEPIEVIEITNPIDSESIEDYEFLGEENVGGMSYEEFKGICIDQNKLSILDSVDQVLKNNIKYEMPFALQKYMDENIESNDDLYISADIIISNADMRHTETQLLEQSQQTYPESYWAKQVISPSGFILYLGVDGELPQLKHHTLVFSDDWRGGFDQIFKDPQRPQDPNYYICNPSKTDPSVAPTGKENLFVLVPIAPGLDSTPESLEAYRDHIIADIAHNCGIPDLADRIEVSQIFSIPQFEQYYNAYKGTALGLAHTFFQSAVRRPQNYSKKIKGLYYAGGYTTPGIGMPMCLISAMMVADRVEKNK